MLVSLHPRFGLHRFAGPAIATGAAVFSGSIFALVLGRDRFVLSTALILWDQMTASLLGSNGSVRLPPWEALL